MPPHAPEAPATQKLFSPDHYWETRLGETWGLAGVGLQGHGRRFNAILYRVRRAVFLREVARLSLDVTAADVLDVGSGTGFYVDLWRELGAKSVSGSDLTGVAVANLSRTRPDVRFNQLDIGAASVPRELGTFDIISAFDVFFHIVDDARFAKAIANIALLLRPGGWLLFSDALLGHNSEHAADTVPQHIRWRTEREVRAVLEAHGFVAGDARPVFVLLNPPMDTSSSLLRRSWSIIARLSARSEASGTVVAALLYPLERALLKFTRLGPTTKILAAQHRGDGS